MLFAVFHLGLLVSGQNHMMYQYLFTNPSKTTEGRTLQSKFVYYHARGGTTKGDFVFNMYTVDGEVYTSDRVDYFIMGGPDVERIVKQYKVGTHVPVYYDKKNPSFAILEPVEFPLGLIVNFVLSFLVALLVGALCLDPWER